MTSSSLNPPEPDELEVSLFGPGYGEAVVVHVGAGKWIVVDSCIEPYSRQPVALRYLRDLRLDADDAVKLIVATHWHDDHIRGLAAVLQECSSARIAISDALAKDEFLALTALYDKSPVRGNSGLNEFILVFRTLGERRARGAPSASPKWALTDRLLFRDDIRLPSQTVQAKVSSLSPSDASLLQSRVSFAQLWPEAGTVRRIPSVTPNHTSVALWVEIGRHKILLGADLETTADPKTGWSAVPNECTVISDKAGVFKVPHHGTESGHYDGVWSDLLIDRPSAVLTPFCRGQTSLPTEKDVARIKNLTDRAYVTAPARRRGYRWRNNVVRDFVNAATRTSEDVHAGWGHVQLRAKITDACAVWRANLYGDACQLQ